MIPEHRFKTLFKSLANDKDHLAIEDIRIFLNEYGFATKKNHINSIFRRCDIDEDWKLDYNEFLNAIGRLNDK